MYLRKRTPDGRSHARQECAKHVAVPMEHIHAIVFCLCEGLTVRGWVGWVVLQSSALTEAPQDSVHYRLLVLAGD